MYARCQGYTSSCEIGLILTPMPNSGAFRPISVVTRNPPECGKSVGVCNANIITAQRVDVIESTYPVMAHRYGMAPESAGAGKFRGGFGIVRKIEIQSEPATVTLSSERFEIGPWESLRRPLRPMCHYA
jgi:hydantoinase/oxoprolinase-like protein